MRGRQSQMKMIIKPGQLKKERKKKRNTVNLLKRQKERIKKENMFTKSTT